jgi:DNA repair protein RecO (recombination protein O)
MLHKTQGIVLSYLKFKESSIIVKIFTEKFGLQSYIVNGVRSARSKNKMALFQPLTIVDMVVYHKGDGKLTRISEIKCAYPYESIPFDVKKVTMAIFLAEVLEKVLKEEEENLAQFAYLRDGLQLLDQKRGAYQSFHLQFLLQLTRYLGFFPESLPDFYAEAHARSLSTHHDEALTLLLDDERLGNHSFSSTIRRDLLSQILDFYEGNLGGMGQVRSLAILQTVLGA